MSNNETIQRECESCAAAGQHGIPAVGHSTNPNWSGYWLCQECIDEYNSRAGEGLFTNEPDSPTV